jgi:hypothetical protein
VDGGELARLDGVPGFICHAANMRQVSVNFTRDPARAVGRFE